VNGVRFQPGIFAYNAGGQSFGAIFHANFQLADAAHPAKAGETLLIYCTALGAVLAAPGDGAAGNGQATKAAAAVSFSGLNAEMPTGLSAGNQPVELSIGGAASNLVRLPVR
jgi:uncharacterized protein (TIGR03437 family)